MFNIVSEDLLEKICVLKIENSAIKAELVSRKHVTMSEECDTSTVWETLSTLTSNILSGSSGGGEDTPSSWPGFESWVIGQEKAIQVALRVVRGEFKRFDQFKVLKNTCNNLSNQNIDLTKRMSALEREINFKFNILDQ